MFYSHDTRFYQICKSRIQPPHEAFRIVHSVQHIIFMCADRVHTLFTAVHALSQVRHIPFIISVAYMAKIVVYDSNRIHRLIDCEILNRSDVGIFFSGLCNLSYKFHGVRIIKRFCSTAIWFTGQFIYAPRISGCLSVAS